MKSITPEWVATYEAKCREERAAMAAVRAALAADPPDADALGRYAARVFDGNCEVGRRPGAAGRCLCAYCTAFHAVRGASTR